MTAGREEHFDVVVAGSGAGGLAAAVTAAHQGLKVVVLEKTALVGGTTARSGGVLWIPCNPVSTAAGIQDSAEQARRYLREEAGSNFDAARVDAFLRHGPRMISWFQEHTSVRFAAVPGLPDYHPWVTGASEGGRSIVAAPYTAGELGSEIRRLRPPLRELTFVGMMFNVSQEISHFFNCTRSVASALYVARRLAQHAFEMAVHGRPQRITNGNALAARLFKSALDAGVEVRTGMAVTGLLRDPSGVRGVTVGEGAGSRRILAGAVVLATGGFPQSVQLRKQLFPHAETGAEHWSPAPEGNVGDGWEFARSVGGATCTDLPNAAAWIPVSLVPRRTGGTGVFPHLIDRYKPGIIAVDSTGMRFVNEANSYHDFGQAMQRCRPEGQPARAWLLCDHRTMRRYGLGYAKPFPLPLWPHLRSGYLVRAGTPEQLAQKTGMDPVVLRRTLEAYNAAARDGRDPEFGKGESAYNRYLGDATHRPNPCVAPVEQGPFYALQVRMGDLGTFAGARTDEYARILDAAGTPVGGLYAVGNDALSVMGGSYPGGGITLGPAMTFGFIAAQHIAEIVRAPQERKREEVTEPVTC